MRRPPRLRLRWPAPALLAWASAWGVFIALRAGGLPQPAALAGAAALGLLAAGFADTGWRRVFIGAGFPLSAAASGLADGVAAWAWLLPLAALAALYPLRSWQDAPLFPTPTGALRGLSRLAPLPAGARLLDAGCGLGDGLRELHREYPGAVLVGLEWSWPLRIACGWRCRLRRVPARVQRGDIWAADWSGFDLVYLFQRPESMLRAGHKAARELKPGSWLASLEFEVPGRPADGVHRGNGGRPVWLYRIPGPADAGRLGPRRTAGSPAGAGT